MRRGGGEEDVGNWRRMGKCAVMVEGGEDGLNGEGKSG